MLSSFYTARIIVPSRKNSMNSYFPKSCNCIYFDFLVLLRFFHFYKLISDLVKFTCSVFVNSWEFSVDKNDYIVTINCYYFVWSSIFIAVFSHGSISKITFSPKFTFNGELFLSWLALFSFLFYLRIRALLLLHFLTWF